MHCSQWIFDMDGTLTDSMTVVWEGAPDALLRRYGRTPRADLRATLLSMGMQEGARYLIREYDLPLTEESYFAVMREVIAELYETVELKPGVRTMLAKLQAEGARMCICSNTWSAQCRTVLTRLGIDEYFDFYVEAQGALHKSRPDVFFQTLTRLGGTDPDRCVVCEDSLYAARTAHDVALAGVGADVGRRQGHDQLRQPLVLQLSLHKKLRFHAGHFAPGVQGAFGDLSHQAAAGAAVHQRVSALPDPPSQLLHRLLQGRIIALVCAQIYRDVHCILPQFRFCLILSRFSPAEKRADRFSLQMPPDCAMLRLSLIHI